MKASFLPVKTKGIFIIHFYVNLKNCLLVLKSFIVFKLTLFFIKSINNNIKYLIYYIKYQYIQQIR